MKPRTPLAILLALPVVAAVCACAVEKAAVRAPGSREAPSTRDDPAARLVRSLDALKQSSTRAETDTDEARSVIEAIGGAAEMQHDGGLPDR